MDGRLLPKRRTIGVNLSVGPFAEHVRLIGELGAGRTSSYVCCVNAHMCVEVDRSAAFAEVVNGADLATADGMPMLRALNLFHKVGQERVAGNDLMPAVLEEAARRDIGVFLYGGQQQVLERIVSTARSQFPGIRMVGVCSPPFRALQEHELDEHVQAINASGAGIVLVSLGCPKQERWMAAMRGRVQGVMLGLGGAFLLYAGVDTRAPKWMRDMSLEWLYRFALEPRRLWKRYLVTNVLFLRLFLSAWIKGPVVGRG